MRCRLPARLPGRPSPPAPARPRSESPSAPEQSVVSRASTPCWVSVCCNSYPACSSALPVLTVGLPNFEQLERRQTVSGCCRRLWHRAFLLRFRLRLCLRRSGLLDPVGRRLFRHDGRGRQLHGWGRAVLVPIGVRHLSPQPWRTLRTPATMLSPTSRIVALVSINEEMATTQAARQTPPRSRSAGAAGRQ